MPPDDARLLAASLRAFRRQHIEPVWEALDTPEPGRLSALWAGLRGLGVAGIGLPEARGGVALDPGCRFVLLRELGAAVPALGFALVSHVAAAALIDAAGAPVPADARLALAASPLDARPEPAFTVDGGRLAGAQRVGLADPDLIAIPARAADGLRLCLVDARRSGLQFDRRPSCHGLRLIPFGDLSVDGIDLPAERVLPWPDGAAIARAADGDLAALLSGMAGELADRAMRYALTRYQGGKMICEHDAVRAMVGPIELARRCARAVAVDAFTGDHPGDGGAAAFAVDLVRQSGLDAIQTLGGYGYMEDYRVERYLRDASTLETAWIHAAARRRDIARARFAALAAQEAP